jgi:hypothetical protein
MGGIIHRSITETTWCVRVERGVPERLRCIPRGGGGGVSGGEVICPACGKSCGMSTTGLERRVADALHGSVDDWIRRGAVVIDC